MKSLKKNIGIFGAFFVVLVLFSNATVLSQEAIEKMENNFETENEVYIDPDIYLTRANLSMLKEALEYVENEDVYKLLEAIIQKIEEQGYVNNEDIKTIQEDLYIFLPIHTGFISSFGLGNCFPVPGFIRMGVTFFMKEWGPSLLVYWNGVYDKKYPSYSPQTYVNIGPLMGSPRYEGSHEGYIFCFVGRCSCGPGGPNWAPTYNVLGAGVLIIVVPGENCKLDYSCSLQSSSSELSISQSTTTLTTIGISSNN